jgi:putative nucleotidyltransferase with HDIG domain
VGWKWRIWRLYQALLPPAIAARETRRSTDWRMFRLLGRGTNGKGDHITLLGDNSRGLLRAVGSFLGEVRPTMLWYASVLTLLAGGMAVLLAITTKTNGSLWVILLLAIVAAIAERGSVQMSTTMDLEESISLLPTLFAAVLLGPLAGLSVGAASMLGDFRAPYLRSLIYAATRAIGGGVAGLVALAVSDLGGGGLGSVVISTLAGAIIVQTLDLGFACLTVWLRRTAGPWETARTIAPVALSAVPLYAPVVILLTVAYERLSPWTLILFFVPALAAQRLFALLQAQRQLTERLSTANDRLERANVSFASALVATLDARDRYTAGHSAAVAVYSRDIAARMGLSAEDQQKAHLAGLVHDIGKVGLPAGLLEKEGPLSLDERRVMQGHSVIGERILANVDGYEQIAHVVRHHHERYDGEGYPDGISGDEVPMLSRIIAVADAYNAMTSDRPYRQAMPSPVARMRLAQAVGSQFDTTVVAAFEAILATADEAYRSATSEEFDFFGDGGALTGYHVTEAAIVA